MSSAGAPSAEHRFVSVLFCDMVDSTGQQFRMDPEQFAALLTGYRQVVFDCVRRRGGYVARMVGDGILVFFGWPAASGQDAQAAVLCALDVAARLRRGGGATPVAARLAIETGWVLVGDIGSADASGAGIEQAGVVGPAPNIAARLQQIARPNGVVAGEGTLELLGERFVTEPADTSHINLPVHVAAAHVLREAGAGDPLGRLRARASQPRRAPTGREASLRAIRACWHLACEGQGQIVLLDGDPGMGKSNLLAAFLREITPERPEVVALFCAAPSRDSPFHPLEELLRLAMGLEPDADPTEISGRSVDFAASLGLSDTGAAAALATLLGAAPADPPEPAQLRRHIFDTLLDLVNWLARERPLLILVEDVHWADPSTLELLGQVTERAATMRLLLIATHRSYDAVPWPQQANVVRLTLGPLDPAAAHEVARACAQMLGVPLDETTRTLIVERAEGVPLFIEEFVRALADHRAPSLRPPGSVAQLLSARLDSLGSAKPLAQVASVLGREAPLPLLDALSGLPREGFEAALDRLTGCGVMVRRGVGDNAVLAFRHALLADAAYRAMPKGRQRELHSRVARTLRLVSPALALTAPETLGHHLAEAGETAEAATLFAAAARFALGSGAFVEAEAHARRATELGETLANGARTPVVLAGLMPLGEALIATRGYAHPDVQEVYARGARLALGMGTAREMLPALRGLTSFYQVRGPMGRAHELSGRVLQIARTAGDAALVCQAERRHGWCLMCEGRIPEAGVLLESALTRVATLDDATRERDRDDAITLSTLAWVDWLTHGRDAALARAKQAAARVGDGSRPLSTAYTLGFIAIVHQLAGDLAGAAHFAERCGTIAQPRGIVYWTAMARALAGWSVAMGNDPAGLPLLRAAIDEYRRTQSEVLRPYLLGLLAEAEQAIGTRDAAFAALSEADGVAAAIGADLFRAPLLGLRARMLTGTARRQTLLAARQTAETQGAPALAARLTAEFGR